MHLYMVNDLLTLTEPKPPQIVLLGNKDHSMSVLSMISSTGVPVRKYR